MDPMVLSHRTRFPYHLPSEYDHSGASAASFSLLGKLTPAESGGSATAEALIKSGTASSKSTADKQRLSIEECNSRHNYSDR